MSSNIKNRAAGAAVVTTAVVRAAAKLGISYEELSRIIGVPEAFISKFGDDGKAKLDAKPFELSLLLVRLSQSLHAIGGGDYRVAREWMRTANEALSAVPLEMIQEPSGLTEVVAYLDARRGFM